MDIKGKLTQWLGPGLEQEVPATFGEELERQCRSIVGTIAFLALASWLPYIEADKFLYPHLNQLIFLRLGFSLAGMIGLILLAFPFFKYRSYYLLFAIIAYLELSAAWILGLVAADPVYMGGFSILILLLPMAPFKRSHSLPLLVLTVVLFIIIGLQTGMTFHKWVDKYGLYNFFAAMMVAITATFLLDSIRRRNYTKSLLVQKKNDELTAANLEISQINQQLETSAIELSRTNKELQRANEIKSDLLGMAAHDLKNPLQVITGYTELLQFKMKSDPYALEKLKMIHTSSDKMIKLITGLLETASITRGKLTIKERPVDMGNYAHSIVSINRQLAEKKSQTIDFCTDASCIVVGDAILLQEVMDNLISNAIKFSPLGTTIWVRLYREHDTIVFQVRDEGPGFTPDDKGKIFNRYQRLSAKPTGGESSTGLGLAIIRDLVELHKGDVLVESKPNNGSTFTVRLPGHE
jgi:signal transduction histidine kinase